MLQWLFHNDDRTSWFRLFVVFFLYSVLSGFLFQCVVIPVLLPSLNDGHGLLINTDSAHFHNVASQMANKMKQDGWSAWVLSPVGSGLPVGIASIVYYFFGPYPWVLLPINAAVHAAAGFALSFILFLALGNMRSSFFGAIPFVVFPSSLSWYGQIHRDDYFILGLYCLLIGWLLLMRLRHSKEGDFLQSGWNLSLVTLCGAIAIWISRPAMLKILAVPITVLTGIFCASVLKSKRERNDESHFKRAAFFLP